MIQKIRTPTQNKTNGRPVFMNKSAFGGDAFTTGGFITCRNTIRLWIGSFRRQGNIFHSVVGHLCDHPLHSSLSSPPITSVYILSFPSFLARVG